mgnify:CR=1 FL=1
MSESSCDEGVEGVQEGPPAVVAVESDSGRRERKSRGGVVPRNALGSSTVRGGGGWKGTTLAGEFGARVSCESQVPPRRLSRHRASAGSPEPSHSPGCGSEVVGRCDDHVAMLVVRLPKDSTPARTDQLPPVVNCKRPELKVVPCYAVPPSLQPPSVIATETESSQDPFWNSLTPSKGICK